MSHHIYAAVQSVSPVCYKKWTRRRNKLFFLLRDFNLLEENKKKERLESNEAMTTAIHRTDAGINKSMVTMMMMTMTKSMNN